MRDCRAKNLFQPKIKDIHSLCEEVHALKAGGKKVVFTNGCFDILHYGHAVYLQDAAAKGDFLIVGVNSDASVKRLKGENRPVVPEDYRAALLAALESVDYVVLFDEPTPLELIRRLKPDVLVKGGDWQKKDIVGADFVEQNGGEVYSISFVKGFSTTAIINKIAQEFGKN